MSQVMGTTGRNNETSPQVSIDRLRLYWDSVGRVIQVCDQAEREEQEWSRARCNGILTDCRKRFCSGLKRLDQSQLTEWEQGFSFVLDDLWHTISPVRTGDRTELIYRIKKAKKIAVALESLLAALMTIEPRESVMLQVEPEPETQARPDVITIKVHMTAFGERDEVRMVQIPCDELEEKNLFELIYRYGQNDEQPQDHPSVSIGDVAELASGELFICGFSTWHAISRDAFEQYQAVAYPGNEDEPTFVAVLYPLVLNAGEAGEYQTKRSTEIHTEAVDRESDRLSQSMMTVKVHLTAFGQKDDVRLVQIPMAELVKTGLLELVHDYGQNDVQPQNHPSVSVGDVVELSTGEFFICGFSDWQPISREQFRAYQQEAYCGAEVAAIWVCSGTDEPEESTTEASEPVISEIPDEPKLKQDQQDQGPKLSEQAADFCWQWLKLTKWGRLMDS